MGMTKEKRERNRRIAISSMAQMLGSFGGKIGGPIGGKSKSAAKVAAARENGKRGGRPRKISASPTTT